MRSTRRFRLAVAAAVLAASLAAGSSAFAGNGGTGHARWHPPPSPSSPPPPPPGTPITRVPSRHRRAGSSMASPRRPRACAACALQPTRSAPTRPWSRTSTTGASRLSTGALRRWHRERARGVLSLSTAPGGQPEVITPRQIAFGASDHYLIRINQSIADCAPDRLHPSDGGDERLSGTLQRLQLRRQRAPRTHDKPVRRRLAAHGDRRPRRDGPLDQQPPAHSRPAEADAREFEPRPVYRDENIDHHTLAHPHVAFMWNPQTVSNPAISANAPAGILARPQVRRLGRAPTSTRSSRRPGVKSALRRFQRAYHRFPFVLGEYGPWDNDYHGRFTRWLFHWEHRHRQVQHGHLLPLDRPQSFYNISNYDMARHDLRQILRAHRFMDFAPELRPRGG